jgi:hypothetical protein
LTLADGEVPSFVCTRRLETTRAIEHIVRGRALV